MILLTVTLLYDNGNKTIPVLQVENHPIAQINNGQADFVFQIDLSNINNTIKDLQEIQNETITSFTINLISGESYTFTTPIKIWDFSDIISDEYKRFITVTFKYEN